ncbi:MAG: hypothetical protein A2750_01965 [Candidatus Yanofskybacteria bacterium RIFCSPHIGHO2_01_FULL_45_42]|uniref:Fibronectin type-III domain-containing protein n=3 Tax=Candidatus Yanofskyibacteriota TaxID=1752733 RepID=A0A1F8F8A1_9BACT|nr:MAG: hypothetical protein A2750_01965 [Candidatus Yanofskybacteria bacterium RIFCSPHIGHO2_01_FULL_45_42]OGN15579.1 MAG: hypothetical protein A3C81_00350 [Candidatus Yanofskybacteria bacterium RIFCSPHIGHO2_02_FULL_46_19]OGN27903.1 MAG: hypothetical protein A3B17_01865 [Candidatus Yanofskybacteria bacterium RIFCSPLOWO2_01_FULL_45_72]OGN32215.1 MAG: hypothetical protein A3J01_01340 [Candidatus Yanofskybacteria bacterium RIFCSPLOWO2_02_FULL_45_18]
MNYQKQKGFGFLVVILLIAAVAGGGYYVWSRYYRVAPGESEAAVPVPEWILTANCVSLGNNNVYEVNLKWDKFPNASRYVVQKRRFSNLNEKFVNVGRVGSSVNIYIDQTNAATWDYQIMATVGGASVYSQVATIQVYPNTCPPTITPSPTLTP